MRRASLALLLLVLVLPPLTASADDRRQLEGSYPAADVRKVSLTSGVGGVEVASHGDESIIVEVLLVPRRGGLFSSMRRAERDVQEARLVADQEDGRLTLGVRSEADDPRFEEHWTLRLPPRIALHLEIGLGDVTLSGLQGGVELEVGVGDAEVDVDGGQVTIDAGVGDVVVRGPAHAFGEVSASGGVGDAVIEVRDRRIESEGMVGHSSTWRGSGSHDLEVQVGVGDARIILR